VERKRRNDKPSLKGKRQRRRNAIPTQIGRGEKEKEYQTKPEVE
jgi:hypothetical protein